ncbi:MAG TPA: AGE family epimerase/isomerase, partial [Jatrophihabitantaceae bacterium]
MVTSALRAQLAAERDRLLAFGRGARSAIGGFGHLDSRGRLVPDAPIPTFQTCRMTYSFVLSVLLGNEDDRELVRGGLHALQHELRDHEHGGWYDTINPDGMPKIETKAAYAHAFVLLAAASATAIGEPGAPELLDEIRTVIDEHFWDNDAGVMRESFDAGWTNSESYRGANANMHTVEAFLAAADATGDAEYLRRAERIARTFIDDFARRYDWRLPEHYSAALDVLPDYNRDDPMHHFRPYGVTPGHLLEWSRLCIQLSASLRAASLDDGWHLDAARALYARAVADGWDADGRPGFVYTVDFEGRPVAHTRMWWVLA